MTERWAQGGSFPVGWANHPSVAMFRVSPGESIRVRTPRQQQRARILWWLGCVALWLASIAWAVLR